MQRSNVIATAQRLTGPRGGEIARSHFQRIQNGWQWVAFDADGAVYQVTEFPDDMLPFHSGRVACLWSLRDCVGDYFHAPRCKREL